jgi:hypothetical protein
MSRVACIKTKTDIGISFVGYTSTNVKTTFDLFKNDNVTDLKYIDNDEVKTITGRVADIKIQFNQSSLNRIKTYDSKLDEDADVVSIDIDNSTANNASIVTIEKKNLLEYNVGNDVAKLEIIPTIKTKMTAVKSDGSEESIDIVEGTYLFGVELIKGIHEETVKGNYQVASFLYGLNKQRSKVSVIGINLVGDTYERVAFEDFTDIGSLGVKATVSDLTSKLQSGEKDKTTGVVVDSGEVADALTLQDSVVISGAKSTVPATNPSRANDTIAPDETVIKGALTVSDSADVTLTGLTITDGALINLGKAKTLTLKNTKVLKLTPTAKKTMAILGQFDSDGKGTVVNIEGCYFADNAKTDTGSIYNFFEFNTKIADGSVIKNNYFTKACCTHNVINLYDVADNATIEISGNHFESSKNAIRIGCVGDRKNVTININDNSFDETDDAPWDGLVMIQPYGTKTENMSGITVNMNRNKGTCTHMLYCFYNKSDTHMNEDNLPKIYLNGRYVTDSLQILTM